MDPVIDKDETKLMPLEEFKDMVLKFQGEELLRLREDKDREVEELIEEANRARRNCSGFQVVVSILVFIYGMLYGVLLKSQNERHLL
jgi:hypothetical protein